MSPDNHMPLAEVDPWVHLRQFTAARIAIGRTGGSQRTASVLDFRRSHAIARDAVFAPFASAALRSALEAGGLATEDLSTAVRDRREYLLRPDLGRRLDESSRGKLARIARSLEAPDLVIIISDGLAAAATDHAAATVLPLVSTLQDSGWNIGPVFVIPLARVKVQDEIGAALNARFTLMLLGERPGLGTPDSLGTYFTAAPCATCTDANRNCVSNIRPEGLPPIDAAAKLAWLLQESRRSGLSGIHLKDKQPIRETMQAPEDGGTSPQIVFGEKAVETLGGV